MRSYSKLLSVALLLALAGLAAGCAQLRARDQLNKGVASYKNGQYAAAIDHFKQAVELDPKLLNARLYLATAYSNQFVPGVVSEENTRNGEAAIKEFEKVLETDPNNVNSVGGIAYLYFQMKKLDEAKKWYQRKIQIDPSDAEAYYSVGVIDWTETYQPRMTLKAELHLQPDEPIKDNKARGALCEKNNPFIEEGFQNLNKAVQLKPDYEDALAYLNLMYREKADCEDTTEARAADNKKADEIIQRVLDLKKKKAEGGTATPAAGQQ